MGDAIPRPTGTQARSMSIPSASSIAGQRINDLYGNGGKRRSQGNAASRPDTCTNLRGTDDTGNIRRSTVVPCHAESRHRIDTDGKRHVRELHDRDESIDVPVEPAPTTLRSTRAIIHDPPLEILPQNTAKEFTHLLSACRRSRKEERRSDEDTILPEENTLRSGQRRREDKKEAEVQKHIEEYPEYNIDKRNSKKRMEKRTKKWIQRIGKASRALARELTALCT